MGSGGFLFLRLLRSQLFDGGAGADEVAIAVDVVDPRDGGPVLRGPGPRCGESGLLAGIRAVP